jgi:hypothetical protein
MRDTPRTNEALNHQGSSYNDVVIRCVRLFECSRELERELALAKKELSDALDDTNELICEQAAAQSSQRPSEEAVRLARESIATAPDYAEPSKAMLRELGMPLFAAMVDENLLLCREIVRLADAPNAAPQASTTVEPHGRATASQDPVRDTEPAVAAPNPNDGMFGMPLEHQPKASDTPRTDALKCRAPSRLMSANLDGSWLCHACGASDERPECKYV